MTERLYEGEANNRRGASLCQICSAPSLNMPSAAGRGWWRRCSARSVWGWPRGCFLCSCAAAAGTPTAPSASNCGTPSSPPTGGRSTAPTASCWPQTAAAGPSAPPPARCRRKSSPSPPTALRTSLASTPPRCWKNSAIAAPTTVCSATGWTAKRQTRYGISAKRTASPASGSIRTQSGGTRRGSSSRPCWGSRMWTTRASPGWN